MQDLINTRIIVDYLYDGTPEVAFILHYIKSNYVEWQKMLIWLKQNNIRGQKLVEFFKNESDDSGAGYLLGCSLIISRMRGHKNTLTRVKINDLN